MTGDIFREAFVDADGFRIRYLEGGSGPVLICLHGGGGLRLSPAHDILAQSYRIIAFEMPGFGKSENSRSTSTEDLARSMNAAVSALNVERYSLMGTSFGSKVALWMAIQRPEPIDAIVLISPAAIRLQEGPVPTHVSPEEGLRLLYAHPERLPQPVTPPPREMMAKHAAFTSRLLGPPRDPAFEAKLADVNIPVLVLFGTVDRVTPPEGAHLFREALPDCHIMLVYDAAHAIDGDRPEALASVAGDFLARKGQFLVRQTSGAIYP